MKNGNAQRRQSFGFCRADIRQSSRFFELFTQGLDDGSAAVEPHNDSGQDEASDHRQPMEFNAEKENENNARTKGRHGNGPGIEPFDQAVSEG